MNLGTTGTTGYEHKQPTPDLLVNGKSQHIPTSAFSTQSMIQTPNQLSVPSSFPQNKNSLETSMVGTMPAMPISNVPTTAQVSLTGSQMVLGTQMSGVQSLLPGSQLPLPGAQMPYTGNQMPLPGGQMPYAGSQVSPPRGQMPFPGPQIPLPGGQMPYPGSQMPLPGGQMPYTGSQMPLPGGQMPYPGSQMPLPGGQMPHVGTQMPLPGGPVPYTGVQMPLMGTQMSSGQMQQFGGQMQVPGGQMPVTLMQGPMAYGQPGVMYPMYGQMYGPGMQQIEIQIQKPVSDEVFRDYLYELIKLAEDATPDKSEIKALAEKAADLDDVPEIDINVSTAARSARRVVAGAVSGLFGVAADAPADADTTWKRERNENSDSDPISESVLLGRASRARRARSASRRAPPPPPHLYVPARSMYLVASESSAVESDVPMDEQPGSENNSALGDVARIRAARPLCILSATGLSAPGHVEHSMFVVGAGSGVDVESAAPAQATNKHVKIRRPKTARHRRNRVSPSPVIEAGSPLQPWATAPLSRLSQLIRTSSASTASLNSRTSDDDTDINQRQRY